MAPVAGRVVHVISSVAVAAEAIMARPEYSGTLAATTSNAAIVAAVYLVGLPEAEVSAADRIASAVDQPDGAVVVVAVVAAVAVDPGLVVADNR